MYKSRIQDDRDKVFIKVYLSLLGLLALFVVASCGKQQADEAQKPAVSAAAEARGRDFELVCRTLRSIPAPIEAAVCLKRNDQVFHSALLNRPESRARFLTGTSKALNLGVYGADMAYCNLYHEYYQSLKHLGAIRGLCQDLQVDDQIDFQAMQRLTTSAGNLDSLISHVNLAFGGVSVRMQDRGQLSLSLMMVTGGWLEGLYLMTSGAQKTNNPAIASKVAEQQVVLGELIALMDQMQHRDSEHQEVFMALKSIQRSFDGVEIRQVFTGESRIEERNGVATFVDNRRTEVVIEPDRLKQICQAVAEARRMVVRA